MDGVAARRVPEHLWVRMQGALDPRGLQKPHRFLLHLARCSADRTVLSRISLPTNKTPGPTAAGPLPTPALASEEHIHTAVGACSVWQQPSRRVGSCIRCAQTMPQIGTLRLLVNRAAARRCEHLHSTQFSHRLDILASHNEVTGQKGDGTRGAPSGADRRRRRPDESPACVLAEGNTRLYALPR